MLDIRAIENQYITKRRHQVIDYTAPQAIKTNGIEMAFYEQGKGLPVVLCHGWPELAYSWRYQMQPLADAGYRAIAPDQRGYGYSSCPPNVEDYDIQHLTDDLCGLLDALETDKAVFVGHDWGGSVIWGMGLLHPDRVAGLVGVNTPFRPRSDIEPIALMKEFFGKNMYIVRFQEPDFSRG
jgi:microsomal epoxide hydrolase/non-specific protein-tyrosine kinase